MVETRQSYSKEKADEDRALYKNSPKGGKGSNFVSENPHAIYHHKHTSYWKSKIWKGGTRRLMSYSLNSSFIRCWPSFTAAGAMPWH